MRKIWYPAVLEIGSESYWVYYPDFDGCIAAGATAAEAAQNAAEVLAMFTQGRREPLPEPSALDAPLDSEAEPVARLLIPLEVAEARELAAA